MTFSMYMEFVKWTKKKPRKGRSSDSVVMVFGQVEEGVNEIRDSEINKHAARNGNQGLHSA